MRLSDSLPVSTDDGASEDKIPICKILQTSTNPPAILDPADALHTVGLQQQVLIFQYRGKFHAVDHQCPHSSFPLSRGALHDIEDFGIVLSVGLTCQKHGWMFDVITGESDRGPYHLKIWDVELRSGKDDESEVWVRKNVKG